MITLQVELSAEEYAQLESRARAVGWTNSTEYLRDLIQRLLTESDADALIRAELRQGLREALQGQTLPLDTLWADDDE